MSDNKEFIKYMLSGGKREEDSWDSLASKFGIRSGEMARGMWRRYRGRTGSIKDKQETQEYIQELEDRVVSLDEDIKNGTGELKGVFKEEIRNLDDLVKKCNIDTKVWDIDRYIQNYWGNSSTPHWQVKAFLSKKSIKESDKIENILSTYKSVYQPLSKNDIIINSNFIRPVSLFLSLADPHIDKKTLDKTSIEDKIDTYLSVLKNLLCRSYQSHNIEEIVYVLGNDYFTSDNYFPSTTKGTPQFTTEEYDDSYEKGFHLAVTSINIIKQFCSNLKVIFIPANHDRTKSFYLLHALEVYFKADSSIVFDRSAENTKMHIFGETSIGMHHGDTILEQMPLYFASKYRKDWGTTKYTEIALADKHHKKEWKFKLSCEEVKGVRMFISPSLTSPDVWHKDHNYDLAILAGTVRIYDKKNGFMGELEERI